MHNISPLPNPFHSAFQHIHATSIASSSSTCTTCQKRNSPLYHPHSLNYQSLMEYHSHSSCPGFIAHCCTSKDDDIEHLAKFITKRVRNQLKERAYVEPPKWMRGKGWITMQFGCCYNYAVDKNGKPPGILDEPVDPIPPLFKVMIRRLVGWHVLPPSCVPDSCIVNIYEPGDCIPPHIDHHDFFRPFCTVSFLSECEMLFESDLRIAGPGQFTGSYAIPLPVGSVLVLKGNGANVAKHCVPAVPTKRISITFRRMGDQKRPLGHVPEPDLLGLQPLPYDSEASKNWRSSLP